MGTKKGSAGAHGLRRWIKHGCRCGVCREKFAQAVDWTHRYVYTDATLQQIADETGVTREFIRQTVDLFLGQPGLGAQLKRAFRDERREVLREVREQQKIAGRVIEGSACVTCGGVNPRPQKTCSPRCARFWPQVRYFVEGDLQRERIARWKVSHPHRVPAGEVEQAKEVLAGRGPTYDSPTWKKREARRWVNVGSRRFEIAVLAYEENWPAFETWPKDVQRQVREYVQGC